MNVVAWMLAGTVIGWIGFSHLRFNPKRGLVVSIIIGIAGGLLGGAWLTPLIETVSMATQARTAAIMEAKVERAGVLVTGTGTDCIVVAAPEGAERARFAGMHTAIGEAVGDCIVRVIRESVAVWQADWAAATARCRPAAE